MAQGTVVMAGSPKHYHNHSALLYLQFDASSSIFFWRHIMRLRFPSRAWWTSKNLKPSVTKYRLFCTVILSKGNVLRCLYWNRYSYFHQGFSKTCFWLHLQKWNIFWPKKKILKPPIKFEIKEIFKQWRSLGIG